MLRHLTAGGLALAAALAGLAVLSGLLATPDIKRASAGNCALVEVRRVMAHTEIVLPAGAFASGSPVRTLFPDARAYAIGWGEEAAFPGALTPVQAIRALAWPTGSVLHIEGLDHAPGEAGGLTLALSREGLARLAREIEAGLALSEDGGPVVTGAGKRGPGSVFVAGTARYHLFHTCNVWTGAHLKQAGAPVLAPALHILPVTLTGELALRGQAHCPPTRS